MLEEKAYNGLFPLNSKKKQVLLERCMRAEDENWDKYIIPSLRMKCIQALAEIFSENQMLEELNEKDRETLVDMLPTTLTIDIQAKNITEESYWKRCCKERGEIIDVQQYGNSWRRAFFERHIQRCIQQYHPAKDDLAELLEQVKICEPFVKTIKIEQLWQKIQVNPVDLYYIHEHNDDEEQENPLLPSEDCQSLQFSTILPMLTNVTEVDISFSAKECGENFAWNLFQITENDCEDLGKALKEKPSLEMFKLRKSLVDDPRALTLLYALEGHPNLQVLDLSHNKIDNLGAKAMAKLILSLPMLTDFNIMNNRIGADGAECLAYTISKHETLKNINLSMNKLTDTGGVLLCRALSQNSVLQTAILSACGFGPDTCRALSEMFSLNTTLLTLVLSNNDLGSEGGELLLAGLEHNCVILMLDVRMCQLGERHEYEVNRKLKHNKHKDEPTYVLPQPYSSFVRAEQRDSEVSQHEGGRSKASFGDITARSRGSVTSRTSATRKSSALSSRSATSKKSLRSLKSVVVSNVTSKINEVTE